MPFMRFHKIEVTERVMPAFFILFAFKLAFYHVVANIPAYAAAAFLPEAIWSALFFTVGVLQLTATLSGNHKFRCRMLFASASLWILWAGMIIYARTSGFGEIIWTLIAVQCFWTYFRVRHSPVK